jgi:deoxyribonuclease-4
VRAARASKKGPPLLGAHMSIAGGLPRAVERGLQVDCTALQIFTKSSNQWRARVLGDEEVATFREAMASGPIDFVMAHDSYLINLASPEPELWEKSLNAFIEEIQRCHLLGVPVLVFHPGAHKGTGEKEGLQRIATAVNRAHEATGDCNVITAMETHAGQGTTLGHRFEHLRDIMAGIKVQERAAVCFDTCHVFAAGYPIHTEEGWDETIKTFDELVGLDRLIAFHVNDSKKGLNCRVDRHAHIGQGEMGLLPFWHLVNDPRTCNLPMVLETPKDDDLALDVENLTVLRGLAGGARP